MEKRPARSVRDVLPGVLKSLGLDERMDEARLLKDWSGVVGEAIFRHSRPRKIRGGRLLVEVENNVWMQEIRFHQGEILEKIQKMFPRLGLKGIRFELERKRDD